MFRGERQITGLERRPLVLKEIEEKPASAGVAVVIVGLDQSRNGENQSDPLIWTIIELVSKPDTEKSAGQISIPAETRKNGESIDDNVIGALAEFCDDTLFSPYVKKHLVKMEGKWYREKVISVGGSHADVAVLIYDGALDFPLKPANPNEVSPNGWIKKSDLQNRSELRDLCKQVILLDEWEDLTRNALESYYNNPDQRRSVFPDDLSSIKHFSTLREFGMDVVVSPRDYKEVEKRLPDAYPLIAEGMNLLAEHQGKEKRDYKKEEKIVSELEKKLLDVGSGVYEVGISEVEGFGIRTVKFTKSFWEKNKEFRGIQQEYYPDDKAPDVYKLMPTTKTVKKSRGGWKLERGDKLGYAEELGKNWYLTLGLKAGGSESGYLGIIPITGIRGLKLRPYDANPGM